MARHAPLAAFLLLIVLLQAALSLGGVPFYLTQLTMAAWYSLVVIGLCLLMGYAGQISLGHAGFFAIGGYLQAAFTTVNLFPAFGIGAGGPVGAVGAAGAGAAGWPAAVRLLRGAGLLVERTDLYGGRLLSVSPWAALPAALLAAALVAALIGLPALKLRGHYLAMATLGFGLIVYRIVLATAVFGEADGLTGVPPFPLPAGLRVSGAPAERVANYYIAWVMVALALILSGNLIHSRVGRALRSIHGNEEAAAALGIDTGRYKLLTFILSAVLAAAGGAFLTHFNGGIGPSEAQTMKSIRYVAVVAVGGMDNLWGTLLMGVLLNFLSLRGVFGSYDDAVFGAVLILIMLFAPRGLLRVGWVRGLWRRAAGAAGKAPTAPPAAAGAMDGDVPREPGRRSPSGEMAGAAGAMDGDVPREPGMAGAAERKPRIEGGHEGTAP
jgi:branched-chain amino acid transport system permease protein